MTTYQFALLTGLLAGLGGARLRASAGRPSRSGTVGLLAAAAAVLLLSPGVGPAVENQVRDVSGLVGLTVLFAHLLLLGAAAATAWHLLVRLEVDERCRPVVTGLVGVAATVMLWRWLVTGGMPALVSSTDQRWYLVAFFCGLAIPAIAVFAAALWARSRDA
ncbi:MAG: hypothetical protein WAV90_00385, partial [Gordonia amarae]